MTQCRGVDGSVIWGCPWWLKKGRGERVKKDTQSECWDKTTDVQEETKMNG